MIAHELAHVAHRDATVMTVVGLPVDALLPGATDGRLAADRRGPLLSGAIGFVARARQHRAVAPPRADRRRAAPRR